MSAIDVKLKGNIMKTNTYIENWRKVATTYNNFEALENARFEAGNAWEKDGVSVFTKTKEYIINWVGQLKILNSYDYQENINGLKDTVDEFEEFTRTNEFLNFYDAEMQERLELVGEIFNLGTFDIADYDAKVFGNFDYTTHTNICIEAYEETYDYDDEDYECSCDSCEDPGHSGWGNLNTQLVHDECYIDFDNLNIEDSRIEELSECKFNLMTIDELKLAKQIIEDEIKSWG